MADAEHAADGAQAHRRAFMLLRKYATPSDLHGLFRIARTWAVIVSVWGLNFVLIPEDLYGRLVLFLFSAVVIGIAMGGLESCVHEASHCTLFKTRRLNESLQILFAAPVLETVESYRESHLVHHRELGGQNDPGMQLYAETGVLRFPDGFIWVMFVRPLFGYHTLLFLRRIAEMICTEPRRSVHLAAFWLPVLAGSYCFGLSWWLAGYVLFPLLFVLPILLFWADVLDHSGLNPWSPLAATRTHVGHLSRAFYPHNEGYHLVHHLHPGIPAHRLADAYRELLVLPWFRHWSLPSQCIGDTVRGIGRRAQAAPPAASASDALGPTMEADAAPAGGSRRQV
jgi:fatty acid desaturase